MKIGIDASRAFVKERTGIEEYSYRLIERFAMMDISSHQVFLYVRKNSTIDLNLPANFFVREIKNRLMWTQLGLSLKMRKEAVDVLFIPSYTVPLIHPANTVVTIHGLEYKYYPQGYPVGERFSLELNTLAAVKWSRKIITPSKNTKRDLMKFYDVDPEKIKVIPHGVINDGGLRPTVDKNEQSFKILFIGRLEKRKNLVGLIKAFEIFRRSVSQNVVCQLILAGKAGFGFERIKEEIRKSPYKRDIILKQYVSEAEKEKLYKEAGLFALVSFYEGFGLPILEAMSYGVPVICSGVSSLGEIAKEAALLVDPRNVEKIAEAIERIFRNSDLRREMIKKGLENAQRFSWEQCAKETLDVLLDSCKGEV